MAKAEKLKTYRKKRDFTKTAEPAGHKVKPSTTGRQFVIQEHAASRLHWDFRLEIEGVLVSWAVPKGPSMDPKEKRLAVQTEDHPLDYASFEGTIPLGEYGGGTVMVWDRGKYYNLKVEADGSEVSMAQSLENGRIEIWLEGKKLRGSFALIKTRLAGKQPQWLLIKTKDALAKPGSDILEEKPKSAMTGRSMEEITLDSMKT